MTLIPVARPSVASVLVVPLANGRAIATATGFIVRKGTNTFLITNRHVVRGRNQHTDAPLDEKTGAIPDSVRILYHTPTQLNAWAQRTERLYDEDEGPLWLEHPFHSGRVDVVALKLHEFDAAESIDYDPWQPQQIAIGPTEHLSVVGFPFGMTSAGSLAIWVQGFVATETLVDHDGLPCFLIDSRTRSGQSGSPVIFYSSGGSYRTVQGGTVLAGGTVIELIGIYSGRINEESDIGIVWKISTVRDILSAETTD